MMQKRIQTGYVRGARSAMMAGVLLLSGRLFGEQFAIQLGDVVGEGVPAPGAGVITDITETDLYTFSATAGQLVFLEEISVAPTFKGWLQWEVRAPSGAFVSGSYFDGKSDGRRTLPETGAYTIKFKTGSNNPEHIGAYSFRARPVPPDQSFNIQIGDSISNGVPAEGAGNIEVPGAQDVYQFDAVAGQSAFFEELSVAGAFKGWLEWQLKAPSGLSVFKDYFEGNNEGRKTLPETGTYTLRFSVGANNVDYLGQYAFRIRYIPPDQSFAIRIGDTVADGVPAAGAGRIEVAGAEDTYTFEGAAGQGVFFERVSVDPRFAGWLQWETKTPSGKSLFSAFLSSGSSIGRKTLPETGVYTMRFRVPHNNPDYVGAYSFRITAADDSRIPLKVGDTVAKGTPAPGAGSIETAGGQDLYTFDAVAGQNVIFEEISVDPAFAGWLRWELKGPSDKTVFADYLKAGRNHSEVLPETGVYTLRLSVGNANPSYVGDYSFRLYSEVFARPDKFAVAPGKTLVIPKPKFLCNDAWEAVDTVGVDLPASTTASGGYITNTPDTVIYLPPSGFSGIDTFVYRLRGQLGGEATAQAEIRVVDDAEQFAMVVSCTRAGPASARVCLLGEAGQKYQVEQSGDLENWSSQASLTADAFGSMEWEYAAESGEPRFYRFRRY
jgi:hypothetical protein